MVEIQKAKNKAYQEALAARRAKGRLSRGRKNVKVSIMQEGQGTVY